MPADDLLLNVRQIGNYSPVTSAPTSALLLLQLAGLGSAYASISPADLVGTALASGGAMAIGGPLTAQSFAGGPAQFTSAAIGMLTAQKACVVDFAANIGTICGIPIASVADVAATVTSFNLRKGPVQLWLEDILCAGGAPIFSPRFKGSPRAATPCPESNSTRLATTAFVTTAIGTAFASYAPLESPNFSGYPTAPTAAPGSSTAQIATTAFVMAAVADSTTGVVSFNGRSGLVVLTAADLTAAGGALIASPVFTGQPAAPTAAPGTATTQLATCAFVMAAVAAATAGVASFNGRTGNVVLTDVDVAAVGVSAFNNRIGPVTLIANDISAAGGAILASPAFTGTPTAPTAAVGTNTTQLATTAFVLAQIAAAGGVATFNGRAGAVTLTAVDVNAAGGPYLPLAGGTLTGNLNGTNGTFSGSVVLQSSTAAQNFQFQNLAGASRGGIFWNPANSGTVIQDYLGGGALTLAGGVLISTSTVAEMPGGGPWTASSDARTKTVLGDYEQGLDDVLMLRPVRYVYRGNDTAADAPSPHAKVAQDQTPFVGLVGQEIEAVFPGMVTKSSGHIDGRAVNDLRRVNANELIYALVNAVKQLAARVATLEAAA